jgi:hypothetical protein
MVLHNFAIIDCEGACLRNKALDKKLFVYEVSLVIFVNGAYKCTYTRQLNYDLRFIDYQTKRDILSIPRRFRNPFRTVRSRFDKEAHHKARKDILDLVNLYGCKLYAKGPTMEETWLFHPELCYRWNKSLKVDLVNIDELANYGIPKYDLIHSDYKLDLIRQFSWSTVDHNFSDEELTSILSEKEIQNTHYSFFECFVFGTIFSAMSS